MALVVDTAVSRVRDNLETSRTGAVCTSYGPQGTRHFGVVSVLCTNHEKDDEIDLAGLVADEVKNVHLTAPEYLQIEKVLEQDIVSANRSLRSHPRTRPKMSVTVLSLNQRAWTAAHIGINRIWLFRGTRLQQLTSDHSSLTPSGPQIIERACGQQESVSPDMLSGQLEEDDILLITSPNLHNHLDGGTLMSCLIDDWPAKKIVDEIVNRAHDARIHEDIAVAVIRIGKLPKPESSISPTSPLPKPGALPEAEQVVDRFLIEKRLRKGRLSNYYKARDTLNDAEVLLKFPSPEFVSSTELITCFIQDEWLSKKQHSQIFLPGYPIARGRRSQLYSVYEYRRGENLSRRLKRKKMLAFSEVQLIANQLVRALENMHAEGLAHRDIRPENIILDKRNKQIFLIGIDQQRIQHLIKEGPGSLLRVMSPQYMPPEVFSDDGWGAQSDIYATGICLYQLACGTYPFGRVKTPAEVLKRKLKPAKNYNASLPDKFVDLLVKACAPIAADRFQTIKQLSDALSDIRVEKNPGRRAFLRRTKARR